ncbi:hypothetical protein [Methanopyrus sp.]
MRRTTALLALLAALVGQASAVSVSPQLTLDTEMKWDQQQGRYVDSDVVARDGYYYQVKGPAVAVDSAGTVLVAWEEWSENGNVVGKIGLRTPSGGAAYVTPESGHVDFAPALVSYGHGKFLLAVTEVPQDNLATQDYGELLVYNVSVSGDQISMDSQPVQVDGNAAYPHMVYLGSDNDGNEYVAIVYEKWNGGSGNVVLQVLKIYTNGNITPVLGQPLVIAEGVCKDYVKDGVHYFGHARPVASVYQQGGSKYLVVVLTDYSQASPNVTSWGFYGEWEGCKVKAYVVDLPADLSTIGELNQEDVHEVQGSLSTSDNTNECPWVCDNVVVYRVGSLWGGMSGDTTIPDINAALIVNSGDGNWTFSSDTTIYRRIYTQTDPTVAKVYTDNGTPYYLSVFADNSGGFGRERLAGVLFRVKDGKIQVIAQYDLTGFGSGYYYYCPALATVNSEYKNAELVVACYKGDSGSRGHSIGDAVILTVGIGDPVDEFMSSAAELLNNLTGTMDVVNNAIFNSYSGLKKKVSDLEKKANELIQTAQELKHTVENLEGRVKKLEQKLERRKVAISPMAVLAAILTLAAYRRYSR